MTVARPQGELASFASSMIRSITLFLVLSSGAFAGWHVHYVPEERAGEYHSPERVTLTYSQDDSGHGTLSGALKEIRERGKMGKLDFIRPHPFTESDEFQNEFMAAFKELAPKEWAAAERSTGNMHDPEIRPLRDYLTAAFMRTGLAKQISRDLDPYGLVITEFGQEKLSYADKNGKRAIRGIFHISVSPRQEAEEELITPKR